MPGRSRHLSGFLVVVGGALAFAAYRATYVEPRSWGAVCAAVSPPWACVPRAALLWLQREQLWGLAGLLCGLAAFLGRGPFWLAIAALVLGIAGVENYNATWGMTGAVLGAWAWLRMTPRATSSAS
jgi:hypothetical protein